MSGNWRNASALACSVWRASSRSSERSKSKNTPFHGWSFKGGVAATIVGGRTVYTNPEAKLT